MADKPENYVTRAAKERLTKASSPRIPTPRISSELVTWLEQQFPPRCYEGKERIEEHLLYAGRVGLIAALRVDMTEQQMGEVALAALADDEDPQAESVTVYSRKAETFAGEPL